MFRTADYFILVAACVSFLLSVYLWFNGQKDAGLFVGIWVPSILAFGAFAKAGREMRREPRGLCRLEQHVWPSQRRVA
jgi:hypothetical protein